MADQDQRNAQAGAKAARRGLNAGGDAVVSGLWTGTKAAGRAAAGLGDVVLNVPGRILGSIFGRGGSAGPRAADAGQQTQQVVSEQDRQAALVKQLADDVSLIQRIAKFRLKGHDVTEKFGDVVPAAQLRWIKALSVQELKIVAEADLRVIAQYLMGQAAHIPGVRNAAEIGSGRPARLGSPSPVNVATSPTYAPNEAAVLDTLAARIQRKRPRPDFNDVYAIHA
jgi:hypothetical protein